MKYGILILSALLLLGLGLATSRPTLAGPTRQTTTTTPANGVGPGDLGTPFAPPPTPSNEGGNNPATANTPATGTAAPTPPANLPGHEPNLTVGYFLPIILILGLLGAGIGALIATRRAAR